ncbi:lipopolysaccharide transport periplasmic protein LptA [Ferrimonas sediminicola]|nr:lipopolysaccharide transport periplasmic protein LptA [Ferrimonas sediminicola]
MKPVKLLLAALMLLGSTGAAALDSDTLQKVEVKADNSRADLPNGMVIYSGRVRITQGTLLINADELRAEATDDKVVTTLIASGSPATYQQMLENGKLAEAQANEIRYDIQKRILTLKGKAEMRQSGSLVQGDSIQYDLEKQMLVAEGSEDEQITTIFQPAEADLKSLTEPKGEKQGETQQ